MNSWGLGTYTGLKLFPDLLADGIVASLLFEAVGEVFDGSARCRGQRQVGCLELPRGRCWRWRCRNRHVGRVLGGGGHDSSRGKKPCSYRAVLKDRQTPCMRVGEANGETAGRQRRFAWGTVMFRRRVGEMVSTNGTSLGSEDRSKGWRVWGPSAPLLRISISTTNASRLWAETPLHPDCFAYKRDLGPCATDGKPRSSLHVPDYH